MSVIFKYAITKGVGPKTFTHEMPVGARIVSVGVASGKPVFWAQCDPDAPKEKRRFIAVMTGEPFFLSGDCLGTAVVRNGPAVDGLDFVLHLFEVPS